MITMKVTSAIREMVEDGFMKGMRDVCAEYLVVDDAAEVLEEDARRRVNLLNSWVDNYYADFNRKFDVEGKSRRLTLPFMYDAARLIWDDLETELEHWPEWSRDQVTKYKSKTKEFAIKIGTTPAQLRDKMIDGSPSEGDAVKMLERAEQVRARYCRDLECLKQFDKKIRAIRRAEKRKEYNLRLKIPRKKKSPDVCSCS